MRERKKSQSGLTNWDNSEKTFPERISWTVCKREITLTEHCTKGNNSGKKSIIYLHVQGSLFKEISTMWIWHTAEKLWRESQGNDQKKKEQFFYGYIVKWKNST